MTQKKDLHSTPRGLEWIGNYVLPLSEQFETLISNDQNKLPKIINCSLLSFVNNGKKPFSIAGKYFIAKF